MKKLVLFFAIAAFTSTVTLAQQAAPVAAKTTKKTATKKTTKRKKAVTKSATTISATPGVSATTTTVVKPTSSIAPVKATTAVAATTKGAGMKFESDKVDYGTINRNESGDRVFTFVNTGTEPLVIKDAKGSCGCTTPEWPKQPILPGEKANIKVHYDTNRVGPFTKTVTLTTNAAEGESKVLTITGTVVDTTPATTTPAASGK